MEKGLTLMETICYIILVSIFTLFIFLVIKNTNISFLKDTAYQEVSEKLKITKLLSGLNISKTKPTINQVGNGFIISSDGIELIKYEDNRLINNLLNSELVLKYNVITNYEIKTNLIIFNLQNSVKDDLIIMRWCI